MNLGSKIKQLRKAAKLTQAELGSRAFNIPESTAQTRVNRIEHGVRDISRDELQQIARVLGVDIENFKGLTPHHETLDILQSVQIIEDTYPELKSLRHILAFALSKKDSFLVNHTWGMVKPYAESQIKKHSSKGG
jgi:transcriptional regulator with XRE-family HTH domain